MFKQILWMAGFLALQPLASASGGYLGGGIGYSDLSGNAKSGLNQAEGGAGISIDGGFKLSDSFSLGLEVQSYAKSAGSGANEVTFTDIPFFMTARYYFADKIANSFYLGAALAVVQESFDFKVFGVHASVSETEFGVGGQAGYNFAVTESFMMGPKLTYLYVLGDPEHYSFYTVMLNLAWLVE